MKRIQTGETDMRRFKVIAIAALLAGAGLMEHGCGKPTGDSDDRLDIFIANKDLPADGTSKTSVTATVRDPSGEPEKREGIAAVFETTAGTVEPAVVPVAAGVATTMLTSSLDPKLAVIVTVHTEPEGLHASDTMRFTQVTAGGITLDCSPSLLEANG